MNAGGATASPPSRSLTGRVDVHTSSSVVTFVGAIQSGDFPVVSSMLAAATAARGGVMVDVSGVDDLGLSGISALQQVARRLRLDGRQLTIRGAGPTAQDLLRDAELSEALVHAVRPETLSPALVDGLAALADAGPTRDVLDAALLLVVSMAQAVIRKADGVSVTLHRDGRYSTVAASNDVVLGMDLDQYDTGQGPCLDAARRGQPFHIDALADEKRWSQFVPRARARGIESILSSPLLDAGAAHGALNIYARTVGAFSEHEKQWADEFASQASSVLTAARKALPSRHLDTHLQQALASRTVIAQAQGWVMHRDRVDADTAWSALTETSRRTSRPLRDVCEDLLGALDGAGDGWRRP